VAVESDADTLPLVIQETLLTSASQGREIDHDAAGSIERNKLD
jgi:hypothetical protein